MEYLTLTWIDYTLFSVLIIGSLLVGLYFGFLGKGQNTVTNYFLGGKSMSVFPVAMSMVASSTSSLNLLGLPAETYLYGIQYWMMWISWIITGLLTYYIFLPVFYKLQLSFTYEYFEIRFNVVVRKLASAMYALTVLTSVPVFVYGPSLAFSQVSGFDLHIIALLLSCICIFYTSIGGFKAVVWADTFQLFYTLSTLGVVLTMGSISAGGPLNVWHKAKLGDRAELFNFDPDPTVRTTFWTIVIGHVAIWTSLSGINPSAVQRFLAVPTYKQSKRVLMLFLALSIMGKSIGCFSGLIAYAKYYDCDPLTTKRIKTADQIIPYFVLDTASQIPGLSGIFISGLLSTALSTLSTSLNTVSGTIYKDFVSPFLATSSLKVNANRTMKIIAVLVGSLCTALIFVVEHLGTIIQISQSFCGAFNGALLGLFTLGMIFPMANSKGAITGAIVSVITMSTIMVNNQIHIWKGSLKYTTKPLYTYGCNDTTLPQVEVGKNMSYEQPFWLFRISFFYYGIIGWILTITVSLLVSNFTKSINDPPMAKEVFSPCIYRFLKSSTTEGQEAQDTCLPTSSIESHNADDPFIIKETKLKQ